MSAKYMNFLAMTWFLSVLICLIIEGAFFGSADNSIINDLSAFYRVPIASTISISVPNIYFFRGMLKILLWDYSFYTGAYEWIRLFWLVIMNSGVAWAIGTTYAPVVANFLRFH